MENSNPIIVKFLEKLANSEKVINLCNFICEAHKRDGANTRKNANQLPSGGAKTNAGKIVFCKIFDIKY